MSSVHTYMNLAGVLVGGLASTKPDSTLSLTVSRLCSASILFYPNCLAKRLSLFLFQLFCSLLPVKKIKSESEVFVIPFKEKPITVQFSSVAQSCPTLCNPMNHSTPPCPSPTPGVHPDSRPSSQWCHPAISSSVVPFSSCPPIPPSMSLFQWVNSSHEGEVNCPWCLHTHPGPK